MIADPVLGGSTTPPVAKIASSLLDVQRLSKSFPVVRGPWPFSARRVHAVHDVSLQIASGEVVGLVGESGSGKTTVGRAVLRLLEPTAGKVRYAGVDLASFAPRELRSFRRKAQMVFQSPMASLNPRMTVAESVGEALAIHGLASSQGVRRVRIMDLLNKVGLSREYLDRYPQTLSGGQCQRVSIARALAAGPEFIVADEPVSALDVSVQAQVLNLLSDLQHELGLTVLFISHDLGVVRYICDRIVVLYLGRMVEAAPAEQLFARPAHPYTQALIASAPVLVPRMQRRVTALKGEIPSPMDPPSGCVFRTRCPIATHECALSVPVLQEVAPGHLCACIKT